MVLGLCGSMKQRACQPSNQRRFLHRANYTYFLRKFCVASNGSKNPCLVLEALVAVLATQLAILDQAHGIFFIHSFKQELWCQFFQPPCTYSDEAWLAGSGNQAILSNGDPQWRWSYEQIESDSRWAVMGVMGCLLAAGCDGESGAPLPCRCSRQPRCNRR